MGKGKKKITLPVKAQKPKQVKAPVKGAKTVKPKKSAISHYALALLHPFSPQADGVRVPEPYSLRTSTYKSRTTFVITSNSGGGFDMVINQHPVYGTVASSLGTITGGLTYTAVAQPAGLALRRVIAAADLATQCSSYRIVAAGVRIKALTNFNGSQGRIYGAIIPASYELPIQFGNGVTLAQAWDCFNVPYDGSSNVSTQLQSLPSGFQFQLSELMAENGVEVTFPIVGPGALNFLDANVFQYEQSEVYQTATGFALGAPGAFTTCAGKSQLLIRGEGMAVSTDVLSVELMYHVEFMPKVGTLVPSGNVSSSPASAQVVHQAHAMASRVSPVRYISHKMTELESMFPSNTLIGKASRAVEKYGGTAERILGLGMHAMSLLS